ncbi:major facilitator superfamily domain-containing protein [Aspergillus pseudotamarii]|uniref:Major facilitator superfamily domain-containing protein n=1 Tax=Aspergillus pseudotamarii TaxID=132259 RepID=A0A5N6SVE2_ASPPS|nr:major facilitator superfamily domain-containing protein [Aspergillus pseudotamarii]KAE8138592.1 major facilitator superfamily domain-containing protein [Aspergillus pseudotamarii]
MTSPATSPPSEPCSVAKEEQASSLVAIPEKSPASAVTQPPPYTAFSRPRRVFILAVVTVAGFLGPLAGNIYLPALPVLEHEFQVSTAAINATVSVFMAVFGFGPLFWSSYADWKGRRPLYLISLVVYIIANVLMAVLPTSFGALVFLRIVQAFGSSAVVSMGAGTVADITEPKRRARAMSYFMLGPQCGPILGPILGGAIVGQASWRWIFAFLAIMAVALWLVMLLFQPETLRARVGNGKPYSDKGWILWPPNPLSCLAPEPERGPPPPKPTLKGYWRLFTYPPIGIVSVNTAILYSSYFGIAVQLPTALENVYHWSSTEVGAGYLAVGVAMIVGSIAGGRWSDWRRARMVKALGDDKVTPEARLRDQIEGIILCAAGLVMFGWFVHRATHPAAVLVSTFLVFSDAGESSSNLGVEDERRKALLQSFTAEEDKRIRRKIDRRFLFLIGMMYIIKTSRIMLTWGIVLACHAAAKNKETLWALRFLLGMCEAGMFPGIAAQLCGWYRSDEMGKPIMWMFGFQNTSGIVGSLLAYGISYMNGLRGMSAWRWVYLLEGLFTILFSGVIYLVLPDWPKSPRTGKWLSEREQDYVEARLSENAPKTADSDFCKEEVIASLKDPRTYAFMLSQVLVNFSGYALTWELPTITTSLGFAGLPRNQLLNIPPSAAAVLAIIFSGWFLKQAYLTRPAYTMFCIMGPMLVCFILLTVLESRVGIYISCVLGNMFYSVYFIPFWAWRTSSLKGTTGAAFTLAFQSCVGQVGGVIGPQLFQSKFAYNGYKTPFGICAGVIGAACLANLWTWWLTRNVEWDVRRIRRLRIKEEKQGRIYADDDVKVYEERQFYKGVTKKGSETHVVETV